MGYASVSRRLVGINPDPSERELGAVAEDRQRGGGEREDVHLGVQRLLGGVPHRARLLTGERARFGDERVVLGVDDGGEVDPVGRLRRRTRTGRPGSERRG